MLIIIIVILILIVILVFWSLCKAAGREDGIMERQYYEHIKSVNLKQNKNIENKGE